jgi:hypothetical protein
MLTGTITRRPFKLFRIAKTRPWRFRPNCLGTRDTSSERSVIEEVCPVPESSGSGDHADSAAGLFYRERKCVCDTYPSAAGGSGAVGRAPKTGMPDYFPSHLPFGCFLSVRSLTR